MKKTIIVILVMLSVLLLCGFSNSSQKLTIPCPSLEPSVIFENDFVAIRVNGLEYNDWYDTYVVKMDIENKGEKTITYYLNRVDVNGYTISALLLGDIYGGMSANADFGFPVDELLLAGIKKIQEISFTVECSYDETNETVCDASTTLKTSDYGTYEETYEFEGEEVYKSEKYRITIKPNKQPSITHPIIIYVENNTDTPMIMSYDNIAINKQMLVSFQSGPYVLPHSHRIEEVYVMLFDETPDLGVLSSFTSAFWIQPYQADGGFTTADIIEIPPATITLP